MAARHHLIPRIGHRRPSLPVQVRRWTPRRPDLHAAWPVASRRRAHRLSRVEIGPACTNPVLDRDFPDPSVVRVGDAYFAYATNASSRNVQVARSSDLERWAYLDDALPVLAPWSVPGRTWSPAVAQVGRRFVMYVTARDRVSGRQAIGLAIGDRPQGPFTAAPTPLVHQVEEGGSIDASVFVDDDGSRYLLWKNDGNASNVATWIYVQPLTADGLTRLGKAVRLVTADRPWEGKLVESPTLCKQDGKYHLLYSANSYDTDRYAIGHAVAASVLGPYRKTEEPLLRTSISEQLIGPGGQDIVVKDGQTWLVYHDWDPSMSYRHMNVDRLSWRDGMPVVELRRRRQPRHPGAPWMWQAADLRRLVVTST